jgi:hypothetical protein
MYTESVAGHAVIQNGNSKLIDEYTPICTMAFTAAAGCFLQAHKIPKGRTFPSRCQIARICVTKSIVRNQLIRGRNPRTYRDELLN